MQRVLLLLLSIFMFFQAYSQRNLTPVFKEVERHLEFLDFHEAEIAIRNARKRYSRNDSIEALWGSFHYVQGDTSRAMVIWNKALQDYPKSAILNNQLLEYYLYRFNCRKAMKRLDILLSLKDPPAKYYILKGILLHEFRDTTGSRKYFERAVSLEDGSIANYHLAVSHINSGDFNSALRFLNFGIKAHPEDGELYYFKGLCLNEMGDTLEANKVWEIAKEKGYGKAVSNYVYGCGKSTLKVDTNKFNKYISIEKKLGNKTYQLLDYELEVHLANGSYSSAFQVLKKMMEISPEKESLHHKKGRIYLLTNNLDSALSCFKSASRLNTENLASIYMQAYCYYLKENYAFAGAVIRKMIESHPDDPRSYLLMGLIMMKEGEGLQAYNYYSKAIEVDPEFPEPYYRRFQIKNIADIEQSALIDLDRAIYLDPEKLNYRLDRATLYLQMGKLNKAKNDIESIRANFPNHPAGFFMMAKFYTLDKKYSKAVEEYKNGFVQGYLLGQDTSLANEASYHLKVESLEPHVGMKQHDFVAKQAKRLIASREGEDHDVYLNIMIYYYRTKQWQEALSYAEIHRGVTPLEKIDKSYFFIRARIKHMLDDRDGCCIDLKKAGYKQAHEPPYYRR